jgi:photosystem II stability/assembly factor-like uncharacterized protein
MKKLLFFVILGVFLVSGCTLQLGSQRQASVAGVFKSFDQGNSWVEKNLFLHSGGSGTIAGVNVLNLTFDPQDNRAIYLAADGAGLLYSYDSGDSWRKAEPVGNGRIESVAIDSKNKCVIYATFANTILKSVDCNRTWAEVYIDTRPDKAVTALAVDHFNNLVVYAGNITGDIFKSIDGGNNWQVINRLQDRINKILIDPKDSRVIYVATKNKGLFKTVNAGGQWFDINNGLRQYSGALENKNLIFDLAQPQSLLLVAKYGLLKTGDGGETWEPIQLITPPATTDIFAIALNPKNNLEIYYTTASTFYKTVDGGRNWITKRLPTSAVATYLAVDPVDSNIIYLGLANLGKK